MFSFLDGLRELSFISVLLRLFLAMTCGGLIGIERTYKRRPAGFRTHILICVGAALTTMTSEYLTLYMHYDADITRLGAGVVAGVGFIGAGTIMVTRRSQVKGLTTAAGFWVAAIVGLALGAGYIEGAVFSTLVVIAVELAFAKVEYRLLDNDPEVNLYIEYLDKKHLENVLSLLQAQEIRVRNLEVSQIAEGKSSCAIVSFRRHSKSAFYELKNELQKLDGVVTVEEL